MNPFDLMKNLGKIQGEMATMQERLKDLRATGSAGGDLVQAEVNGQLRLVSLKLAPECVDARDIPMLQDLIVLAVNDALAKVKEKSAEEMAKITGLPLPPGGFPGL